MSSTHSRIKQGWFKWYNRCCDCFLDKNLVADSGKLATLIMPFRPTPRKNLPKFTCTHAVTGRAQRSFVLNLAKRNDSYTTRFPRPLLCSTYLIKMNFVVLVLYILVLMFRDVIGGTLAALRFVFLQLL